MNTTQIKFGTDGWRAVIARDYTFANLGRLATGIAEYINGKEGTLFVGYDNRFMSEKYAAFISAVLTDHGIDTELSSCSVTTPMVSHRVNRKSGILGIMISASHNPASYNGLKIKEPYGGSASDETVSRITESLNGEEYRGKTYGMKYEGAVAGWGEEYLGDLEEIIPSGRMKIAVDYMHGSAFPYFGNLLREKGYEVTEVRSGRDPLFGGRSPEPKPSTLNPLINAVRETGSDIGFAFDGDGDRIAMVDETGRLLSSQIIFSILAEDLLNRGERGRLIKTVAGTYVIDRLREEYGVEDVIVPIGFKNICPELQKEGALVAGEESGGIGFGDYIPERDAIYTACRMISTVTGRGLAAGELWDSISRKYGNSVYLRDDIRVEEGMDKQKLLARIRNRLETAEFPWKVAGRTEIDGIRINMDNGYWLLVRPSGTEPVTRIYAETETEEDTRKLLKIGKGLIR